MQKSLFLFFAPEPSATFEPTIPRKQRKLDVPFFTETALYGRISNRFKSCLISNAWNSCKILSQDSPSTNEQVTDLRFDNSGALSIVSTSNGKLIVVDFDSSLISKTPQQLFSLQATNSFEPITSAIWRPNGSSGQQSDVLCGLGRSPDVLLYDLETSQNESPKAILHIKDTDNSQRRRLQAGSALSLSFLNNSTPCCGFGNGSLSFWDLRTNCFPVNSIETNCGPLWYSFPAIGNDFEVVSGSPSGLISVCDIRMNSRVGNSLFNHINLFDALKKSNGYMTGILIGLALCPFLPNLVCFLISNDRDHLFIGIYDIIKLKLCSWNCIDNGLDEERPLLSYITYESKMKIIFPRDQPNPNSIQVVCSTNNGIEFIKNLSLCSDYDPNEQDIIQSVALDCGMSCKSFDIHPILTHTLLCSLKKFSFINHSTLIQINKKNKYFTVHYVRILMFPLFKLSFNFPDLQHFFSVANWNVLCFDFFLCLQNKKT